MSSRPLLRSALCAWLLLSFSCARNTESVRPAPPADAAPAPPPAPRTPPRSDVEDNPDVCRVARDRLRQLVRQAAQGCSRSNPCLVDEDCLVRTAAADAAEVQAARQAMEQACPSRPITRDSCIVGPAQCESGRCVRISAERPPGSAR
jgi:hypothetical protein